MTIQFCSDLSVSNVELLQQSLKQEIEQLDHASLPLQDALEHSSYVSDSPVTVIVLGLSIRGASILLRVSILYTGVISGSCCADDPVPCDELAECCQLEFQVNRHNGLAQVSLLS